MADTVSVTQAGWIVANGAGDRWRTWESGFSAWTEDREQATRYARRQDAEAVHSEDEDAWLIQPYTPVEPSNASEEEESHGDGFDHVHRWINTAYGVHPRDVTPRFTRFCMVTAWVAGSKSSRASTQPAPAFPREEVASVAATLWRNLEDGDKRMARENCACLGFLAREGRLPSWEELPGAYEAMDATLLQGKQP